MFSKLHATVFCFTALALIGCDKAPPAPPLPQTTPTPLQTAPTTGAGTDASVPAAGSVLTPAPQAKADPAAGRTNSTLSRSQESTAMPLPGQNNDHSAPLPPAKRASGP